MPSFSWQQNVIVLAGDSCVPTIAELEKLLLKATSWVLDVPHFCRSMFAKRTNVGKSLQKLQHTAERGMTTSMGFVLY